MERTNIPTSPVQRAQLAALGFVRVDGLRAVEPWKAEEASEEDIVTANAKALGCYDGNNSRVVITTLGCEIWLAYHPGGEFWAKIKSITAELCPNGQGAFVPCSNGEELSFDSVMARLSNPDWQPQY